MANRRKGLGEAVTFTFRVSEACGEEAEALATLRRRRTGAAVDGRDILREAIRRGLATMRAELETEPVQTVLRVDPRPAHAA